LYESGELVAGAGDYAAEHGLIKALPIKKRRHFIVAAIFYY
jgi:hypothetical protein